MKESDDLKTLKPEGHEAYKLENQEYRPILKSPWTLEELFDLSESYRARFRKDLKAAGILLTDLILDRAYAEINSTQRLIPVVYAAGMVTNIIEKKFDVVENAYQILLKDIIKQYKGTLVIFREELRLLRDKSGMDAEGNIDPNFKLMFYTRIASIKVEL